MKVHYPAEKTVSVWIGTFDHEDDFDEAVNGDVATRLALPTPIAAICETTFEDKPVPVADLIEGFSGWQTFSPEVQAAADQCGIQSANAALVCYYLKIEDASPSWGHLRFLGSFAGQDVGT